MAFTIFSNSTTAYAEEVSDNFLYVGSGDLLPLAPTLTMESTDGAYYLGSSQYKWDEIYANEIQSIQSIVNPSWFVISNLVNTSVSSRIEITGSIYNYREFLVDSDVYMYINGNSGSAYIYTSLIKDGSGNVIPQAGSVGSDGTYSPFGTKFVSYNPFSLVVKILSSTKYSDAGVRLLTTRYQSLETLTSIVLLTKRAVVLAR